MASGPPPSVLPRQPLLTRLAGLPWELRRRIYRHAGHFTQLLHGELVQPITRHQATLVVIDCFQSDNVAKAHMLPRFELEFEPLFIRSPEMQLQLWMLFPRQLAPAYYTALDLVPDCEPPVVGSLASLFNNLKPHLREVAVDLLRLVHRRVRPEQGSPLADELLNYAIKLGRLDVVKEVLPLTDQAEQPSKATFDLAGKVGQLDIVEHLVDSITSVEAAANVSLDGAVEGGNAEVVEHLKSRFPDLKPSPAAEHTVRQAIQGGHSQFVWEMLRTHLREGGEHALREVKEWAAESGNMQLLRLVLERDIGGPLTKKAMDKAAGNGHLEIVKFLHSYTRVGCTTDAMDEAARNNRLWVVQWLHLNRTEGCTTEAMDGASENGHLEVLKWLHKYRKEGCTPLAFTWASIYGHIEVFEWLWDAMPAMRPTVRHMRSATYSGQFWIVERFTKQTREDLSELLGSALSGGHLFLAEWLMSLKRCTPNSAMMTDIAKHGHMDCAVWLHTKLIQLNPAGVSYPPAAIEQACRRNHVLIVKFLMETCRVKLSDTAFNTLATAHISLVQYLLQREPQRYGWAAIGAKARLGGFVRTANLIAEHVGSE
eukprot:jgi/Hompol1/3033/HPOL_003103-RA